MGRLTPALNAHTLIGLDTTPFIYFWEHHPAYFTLSEEIFRYLTQSEMQGITSIITLIEVCVHPQRLGRQDLITAYEQILLHSPQITLLPITVTLSRQAIRLRARYNIQVPDALQIAAALEGGATLFVTNDRQLSKVQELEVLLMDDYTE